VPPCRRGSKELNSHRQLSTVNNQRSSVIGHRSSGHRSSVIGHRSSPPPVRLLQPDLLKHLFMEKRVIGIILTLLGVVGLIMAAVNFMNAKGVQGRDVKQIIIYGVLGAIFFFAGIGLVRSTKDRPT
jgi:hypothetical protein